MNTVELIQNYKEVRSRLHNLPKKAIVIPINAPRPLTSFPEPTPLESQLIFLKLQPPQIARIVAIFSDLLQSIQKEEPSPSTPDPVSMDKIIRIVCEGERLTRTQVISNRRTKPEAVARMMIAYLARVHTVLSLKGISKRLGDRDHTTVLHASRRGYQKKIDDPDFSARLCVYEAKLGVVDNGDNGVFMFKDSTQRAFKKRSKDESVV